MTRVQCLILGTIILFGCGTKRPQPTLDPDIQADSEIEFAIAIEPWMDFDSLKESSFHEIEKFGRLTIPGKWKRSDRGSQGPRYFSYENSENYRLTFDIGLLDTMNFYSKDMAKAELLTALYEQGIMVWQQKNGQFKVIEQNQDNTISKLVIEPTKQIFFLCGIKDNKAMTLYLAPKTPDDLKSVDLLKQIFGIWKK